ncbi:hypothetical protein CIW48_27320 [Methylobacterium sp. P1-11]|uniref:hypothetical protein n=1 Tax=Methylobacterium sp. P1-11 TaxID=2024616 RepID=UPI0011EC33AC|nr:hypothetical protein [Methylobacterium sp. P1-11]KAA0117913.1 hypothetical protein CIW48_27320 [Methylobacterium sp. P1-11]
MTALGLVLPLRIERLEEAVKVVGAHGKSALYVYISADRERRLQTGRLSPEEGVEAARICARALTDALSALIAND